MKIVLISNFLNEHMIPLCRAFISHSRVEKFCFIALAEISQERKDIGFEDANKAYPFVCCAYESRELYDRAIRLTKEADVAIIGHAPDEWVALRMKTNKLTFLCSERFYKKGLWRRFVPSSYQKKRQRILQYKEKELYYLTIGAYTPYDLNFIGFPLEKCFQWAYFPQTIAIMKRQKCDTGAKIKILWVGRLIREKHPEMAIKIAEELKKRNVDFELSLVGDGLLYQKLDDMIKKKSLSDKVYLLGNCEPKKTQAYMCQSDIFLFTSDYWEGWGAVLNEAMAQGCVPVASSKAGASEILIRHGENGFLFKKYHEAVENIIGILADPVQRERLSRAAAATVHEKWEAGNAAKKFVQAAERLRKGYDIKNSRFRDEPMDYAVLRKAGNYFYTQ